MRTPLFSAIAAMIAFSGAAVSLVCEAQDATGATATERLQTDSPKATRFGNTFIAPAGWSVTSRGDAVVLEAPEGGSWVVLVDLKARDADAAVAGAWAAFKPDAPWPLKIATPIADRDGWTDRRAYDYQTSPNERRDVSVDVRRAGDTWTAVIYDVAQDVGEKRGAQVALVMGKLLPKGYVRESFAGRKAHALDEARVAELKRFVRQAMAATGVPGVSLGLYQDGKVVFADGFGVRDLGSSAPVDADTRFMVASNTKALVTLMLARLVDQKKIRWDEPVVDLFPGFKLGNAETTKKVLVKHLICACTGMPRQDLEWLLEFSQLTPERTMTLLGTMQPTSAFGELFQYSNPMAAAAGYIGGHTAYPRLEIGAAYDRAMNEMVFKPLAMRNTTQDFDRARQGDAATPHAPDVDGQPAHAVWQANRSIVPVRPAGAVWSTANDMLKYIAMELAEGRLPDGSTLVSSDALLARRAPQVVVGPDVSYGMGLMVDTVYGTPVVHHGGDMIGFHSDMMWLPEQGVGAVILTNGDPGWLIRDAFRRKLLEVLFDGKPEAGQRIEAQAKAFFDDLAADRKLLSLPPDADVVNGLAPVYSNPQIGGVKVTRQPGSTVFDFGEWASAVGTTANPDGTFSVKTVVPGFNDLDFVVGRQGGKRTLTLRDAQHEYVLEEK